MKFIKFMWYMPLYAWQFSKLKFIAPYTTQHILAAELFIKDLITKEYMQGNSNITPNGEIMAKINKFIGFKPDISIMQKYFILRDLNLSKDQIEKLWSINYETVR